MGRCPSGILNMFNDLYSNTIEMKADQKMTPFTKEHLGRPAIRLASCGRDACGNQVYTAVAEEGYIEAMSEDGEYIKFATKGWFWTSSNWYSARAIRLVGEVPSIKSATDCTIHY